jgi:signal transduction histidine kinase
MEKMRFENEQQQTAKEELEVSNEELLSTNNELELAIKSNEERNKLVDYFNNMLLRLMQETKDGLDARIRDMAGEMKGQVPPERRELLETLLDDDRKSATALHDVTSLLMAFSAKMRIEQVNLSSLVTSSINDLKHDDPQANVYIFIAKTLHAYADRGLIETALQYLLRDAWQHVHENLNGRIFFMLSQEDSRFSFVIADSRKDYDIAEVKWLSEPWEYSEEALPPSKFRMSMAKLIIEKNGGEIWADDKKGLYSVHFKLPIIPMP